jgi:hypothetical protein
MDPTLVVRVGLAIAVLVFLDALFVELRRIAREGKRLITRLEAYAGLPIFSLIATCEGDLERVAGALEALDPLLTRAGDAWLVMRSFGRYRPAGYRPNGILPD